MGHWTRIFVKPVVFTLFFSLCFVSTHAWGEDSEVFDSLTESQEDQYYGPFIQVNVAARHLQVFDEQKNHVKTYPIAVGQTRFKTPLGKRKMSHLVWNPWWIPPKTSAWAKNEKDTPPGPRNPLGPVKMKLGGGIMFHGTNKPNSIGQPRSHGCMRMYSEDAIELATWIQNRVANNKTTPETWNDFKAKVDSHKRSSFHVNFETPVEIDIIYDIAEVKNNRLHIYRDVYWRVNDKIKEVESALIEAGHKVDKFDLDYIKDQIKSANNKKDLEFDLSLLLKKNKHLRDQDGQVALSEGVSQKM